MARKLPLWKPSTQRIETCRMTQFRRYVEIISGLNLAKYQELHRWSINCPEAFWSLAWDMCGIVGEKGSVSYLADPDPLKVTFFPQARLNVVDTFLRDADDRDAIVFVGENDTRIVWSRAKLLDDVAALAAALREHGVVQGDRVVGYAPNMPQTVAAMLATASIGAVWSSCAPESGPDIVVDRFAQLSPKVLFTSDGYSYGGKTYETLKAVQEIASRVPSISQVVVWPYVGHAEDLPVGMVTYNAFKVKNAAPMEPVQIGFRDPQYVLFSSGTTGKPKCIEHSGAGTLLRLMVEHQLHCDLRPGDRMFYYTTCNWMMWNWQVAALASEATIVLYDGNPMYPDANRLFDLAQTEAVTHLGVSAKYIDVTLKRGLRPAQSHDLAALRVVMSTGSPLSPDGYRHIYADWKPDVQLASICGGTDILGAFVGGSPELPVYEGEIPCPTLGLDVAVLADDATPVSETAGELVCRNAHPSMPTRFLGDPDMSRYRDSYYDKFPNIWRQGDFAIQTERGGFVVLGRSDATLNPGGIRIGTAEIYRQIDKMAVIEDAVVIGQSQDKDVRVLLFVQLSDGAVLDETLVALIKSEIRKNATPRHVPALIMQVPEVPRTKSGKTAELAVSDVVNSRPVRDLSGLANPLALEHFGDHPLLLTSKDNTNAS